MLQRKEALEAILPGYTLLRTAESGVEPACLYMARTARDIEALAAAGIPENHLYAGMRGLSEADIPAALGTCRLVAGSLEELRLLHRVALAENGPGRLAAVGLRLIPAAYDGGGLWGVREADLPGLAAELKRLSAISVQGCFVEARLEGLHGQALGRYFRDCYELAKRMTVILPCSMPYLCAAGAADAVARNAREYPETLAEVQRAAEIVSMQNRTAFYARLLIT